jgi:hypothetical protein
MLSIEEIKLLIEKLEKIKGHDFQKIIDDNLKILKELQETTDAANSSQIERMNKTLDWFRRDENEKHNKNKNINFNQDLLYNAIYTKIKNFSKTGAEAIQYNSLEIGPGYGKFSRCFLPWRLNYFVDLLPESEVKIKKKFHPNHHRYIKFYLTNRTACTEIPDGSISFVFSWDTFVFFKQEHIKEYLDDLYRVLLPKGYIFIQYTNCEYDFDLQESKRGYWNYNTKSTMTKIIKETGYDVIEMDQFKPGANYAIFQKPGKSNTVLYKTLDIS